MNKEQKMILKQIEKQIQLNLKLCVKRLGCKASSNSIYLKSDYFFIHALWFVRFWDNKYQVVLRPYIKPNNYDTIFWKILDMEENEKQKDAFRANGAFVAPSIQLSERTYNVLENEDFEHVCAILTNDFMENSRVFISNVSNAFVNFDSYILSLSGIMDESLLKILAYINLDKREQAIIIAQNEITQGRTGRFENKGIGFNEYVVKYFK